MSDTGLPARSFERQDEGDDGLFYAPARLVTHLDEAATKALTAYYRELLRPARPCWT